MNDRILTSNVQLQEQWAACLATTLFNDYKLGLSDGQMISLADALVEAVPALIANVNSGPLLRRALAENETPCSHPASTGVKAWKCDLCGDLRELPHGLDAWQCAACKALNSPSRIHCFSCGAQPQLQQETVATPGAADGRAVRASSSAVSASSAFLAPGAALPETKAGVPNYNLPPWHLSQRVPGCQCDGCRSL